MTIDVCDGCLTPLVSAEGQLIVAAFLSNGENHG